MLRIHSRNTLHWPHLPRRAIDVCSGDRTTFSLSESRVQRGLFILGKFQERRASEEYPLKKNFTKSERNNVPFVSSFLSKKSLSFLIEIFRFCFTFSKQTSYYLCLKKEKKNHFFEWNDVFSISIFDLSVSSHWQKRSGRIFLDNKKKINPNLEILKKY